MEWKMGNENGEKCEGDKDGRTATKRLLVSLAAH